MFFMEERTRLFQSSTVDISKNQSATGTLAKSKRKTFVRSAQEKSSQTTVRCSKCDKPGQFARECVSKGVVAPEGAKSEITRGQRQSTNLL